MIQNLFYLLLLLAGFPTGIILARMCSDEIKSWRKRFEIISFLSFVILMTTLFIPANTFDYKIPVVLSLFFMIITCLTVVWKSY